jgi:hypothetical protein
MLERAVSQRDGGLHLRERCQNIGRPPVRKFDPSLWQDRGQATRFKSTVGTALPPFN